jgi:hypothetical protein
VRLAQSTDVSGAHRAWILVALLVVGGPATAGVVDAPRVVIAGDHIGNAFLQRPNTRIWVETSSGPRRLLKIKSPRAAAEQSSLPVPSSFSLLCLGAAALLSAHMIRRRVMARPPA